MTFKEILSCVNDNLGLILVFLTVSLGIIDKSKKIAGKPITAIFRWIGKIANEDMNKDIQQVKKQQEDINSNMNNLSETLNDLSMTVADNHRKEMKIFISDFANDLRNGIVKSEAQFIAIMEQTKEYLSNGWNSKVKLDAEYIEDEFKKKFYDSIPLTTHRRATKKK